MGVRVYLLPFRIETVWLAIDATHVAQIWGNGVAPGSVGAALWPGFWRGMAVLSRSSIWAKFSGIPRFPPVSRGDERSSVRRRGNWLAIMVDEIREAQVVAKRCAGRVKSANTATPVTNMEADDLILPIVDPVAIVREAISSDPALAKSSNDREFGHADTGMASVMESGTSQRTDERRFVVFPHGDISMESLRVGSPHFGIRGSDGTEPKESPDARWLVLQTTDGTVLSPVEVAEPADRHGQVVWIAPMPPQCGKPPTAPLRLRSRKTKCCF